MNRNGGRAEIELLLLENATIMLFIVEINHENTLHSVYDLLETYNQFQNAYCLHEYPYTKLYVCATRTLRHNMLYSIRETYVLTLCV